MHHNINYHHNISIIVLPKTQILYSFIYLHLLSFFILTNYHVWEWRSMCCWVVGNTDISHAYLRRAFECQGTGWRFLSHYIIFYYIILLTTTIIITVCFRLKWLPQSVQQKLFFLVWLVVAWVCSSSDLILPFITVFSVRFGTLWGSRGHIVGR